MAGAPDRTASVFVIGAGVSAALGLPNTRELLHRVHDLASSNRFWGQTMDLTTRLETAYGFFYPEDRQTGFRPDAVDFFSLLKAYGEVGAGLAGGLKTSAALLTDLKFAIANALVYDLRQADERLVQTHAELNRILTPGNVVITLNWDLVLERYCWLHDIPCRLWGAIDPSAVLILKLHGSVDWTQREHAKKPVGIDDYSLLRERISKSHPYTIQIGDDEGILRTRAIEQWNAAWQRIKSRAESPFIVTMSQGKGSDLSQIEGVWRSAHDALSAASEIELVGYSLPHDDVEVRTLLRAGLKRGPRDARVIVRNPSPDVHDRVRSYLDRKAKSNYVPFPGFP